MKITNEYGLPKPFVDMADRERKMAPDHFSVTECLKGIRELILTRRHSEQISVDVADMLWLLFGTAVHGILERCQESEHQIKETRLSHQVSCSKISGQFDLYDASTGTVTDYKTCSVWKIMFGNFDDWRRQLITYAWLLEKAGFPCRRGEIVAMMKDHSKRDAKFKADYPPRPVKVIQFDFTQQDMQEAEAWITTRIEQIELAMMKADHELPLCLPEERYHQDDAWAVKKAGNKKALKVFGTKAEAEAWITREHAAEDQEQREHLALHPKAKEKALTAYDLEFREGDDKKCMDYCACCEFCTHYQNVVLPKMQGAV